MDIRRIEGIDYRQRVFMSESYKEQPATDAEENVQSLNLLEEMLSSSNEMAELLSEFGRSGKLGRKNNDTDNDFVSSMVDDQADEKLITLIQEVAKLKLTTLNNLLNCARRYFINDSDLILALREMLLSRMLSELKKKKIREAIADLEKFSDIRKMRSGINVGRSARRFSDKSLSAHDLRNSYLNFLEQERPAGFIYKEIIDDYGFENRTRLLAFFLSALVADIKSNQPGIQYSEFGPLSAKLTDARTLHTLDLLLNEKFSKFPFRDQMRNKDVMLVDADIVGLYIYGLLDLVKFKSMLDSFSKNFMSFLLVKHRGTVIQSLRSIFSLTPEFLFIDSYYYEATIEHLAFILLKIHEKERRVGIWNEKYEQHS
ncbi:type III secretion protein W [Izhakiella capsodis]|uniref:Type III secretion protein W n=1 Tax=Izhakiella capsodis TaxID=1367852 RepID=A0A1I5AVT4_9GAMM|nr:type III secretion system gatekeeper subunit SctW [Izhakiella capsodis]SFN66329.1 type III secretion protein W [Izhakiella capsodis]